jgi:hypothetical protein
MAEVVVVEHQRHQVEPARADGSRHRAVEGLRDRDDVGSDRLFQPLGERGAGRARRLRVDATAGRDRAREQLGRVAAAGADVEHDHAGPHADERQHLDRLSAHVVAAVGLAAIAGGDDRLDLRPRERRRAAACRRLG